MSSVPGLDEGSWSELGWIAGAVLVSLLLHVVVAEGVSSLPPRQPRRHEWVEMRVNEVRPPPPEPVPEPEPAPEPPKPKPKLKEVVDYHPPEPTPQPPPPPEAKPVPRVVQGLSNESFLKGSGTGLEVRAGNTTSTRATSEVLPLDEATPAPVVAYASVTNPPKVRYKPLIEVPESVKAAKIEGRVELLLTIDADGKVTDVEVVSSLHPDADAACVAALKASRWKAGDKDGAPVATRNVPYSCRFEMSSR